MRQKILGYAFLLVLGACSSTPAYHNVTYIPPATPGGRLCMEQCNKSRDYCHQSCDLDNRACFNEVQAAAERDYDHYANTRFGERLPNELLPSDFEHPDACIADKKSCYADCNQPYDSCYKSCGGAVTVTTSCQFLCFE